MTKKPFFLFVLMLAFVMSCANTIEERKAAKEIKDYITTNPVGADIFWAKDRTNFAGPIGASPLQNTISRQEVMLRCYKVRMKGYYDSNPIFRYAGEENHHFHFDLKPLEVVEGLEHSVLLTGSADALERRTIGGPSESRPRLSPEKRWLLFQASGFGPKATYKSILQKLDLILGTRVILTPGSSDSREGDWLPDVSGIVFVSDKLGDQTIVQSLGTSEETAVKFISNPAIGPARYPSISSDATRVAFSVFWSERKNQISAMNLNGSALFFRSFRV